MSISKIPKDTLTAKNVAGKRTKLKTSGAKGDSLKVVSDQEYLLKSILIQLKINNKILNEVHDLNVNEQDIK